jgi:hypothetical protein
VEAIFNTAIEIWNYCYVFVKTLLTVSPEYMFDGSVWKVVEVLHSALLPVAYTMMVVWFLWGVISTTSSLKEIKSLEHVFGMLIKLAIAKWVIEQSLAIVLMISDVALSINKALAGTAYGDPKMALFFPAEDLKDCIKLDAWSDIDNWVLILILSIVFLLVSIGTGITLIMIAVGRFYRLFLYAAFSPIPLSSFACGDPQYSGIGRQYLKSFMGVCMQAAVIYLALIIFIPFMGGLQAAYMFDIEDALIGFIVKAIFAQVLLLVLIKGSDQVVKELGFG